MHKISIIRKEMESIFKGWNENFRDGILEMWKYKQTKTLNGIKIRLATVKDKVGDLKDIKI